MTDVLSIHPRSLENSLKFENLFCWAGARAKTTFGILQLKSNFFTGSFFKALGMRFSRELKREKPLYLVHSYSLLVYGNNHSSLPISRCPSRPPGTWHTKASQRTPLFRALSISGWISAAFPTISVLTARWTSAAVMVLSCPKWTPCVSNGVELTGFKSF